MTAPVDSVAACSDMRGTGWMVRGSCGSRKHIRILSHNRDCDLRSAAGTQLGYVILGSSVKKRKYREVKV